MRKLNLEPYFVKVLDGDGKEITFPYRVRESIENIMLATGPITTQRLTMVGLLRNARITQKITECKEQHILLEENEYEIMVKSFEEFQGFGRFDVELIKRIQNAEIVEVRENVNPPEEPLK